MELFEEIRRGYAAGETVQGLAKKHGVHRRMVRQAIASAIPPGRKKHARKQPMIGPVKDAIERMLDSDRQAPRKQRHTAHRIWARLREEHPEFPIAEVTVRQYVRKRKQELGGRVAFVPQSYDWGQEAQVDWSRRISRVLPFPFHFLNNNGAMNVKPANYSWQTFYDQVIELTRYSFSTRAIFRRFLATQGVTARWVNLVRAVSTEGFGRARYYREIRHRLDTDPQFLPYFEQESSVLPQFYKSIVREDLGPLMEWLPEGALYHDPNAYLKSERSQDVVALV